ncbi:MAG TPA: hypothetical protein PK922_14455, partial [Syntrophorhabdus sp.]|nr:hypothetical protein [Syntrophorhabdus sp.]
MSYLFHQDNEDSQYQGKKFKPFLKRILSPLLGASLFIIAFWALYIELSKYHFKDIITSLHMIPSRSLLLSLLLTVASYGIKIGYDYFGSSHQSVPGLVQGIDF